LTTTLTDAPAAPPAAPRAASPSARLLYAVTHPATARAFLRGQLGSMRERGFDVQLVCGPGSEVDELARTEGIEATVVPLEREVSPARDLRALAGLTRVMRRLGPDVVNAGTPKAGLLALMAAAAAGVPARVYLLRGLRLETLGGSRRRLAGLAERVAAACAHRVICVSESLRREAVARRLVPAHKAVVLANGSSNGVDAARFRVTESLRDRARQLRRELGIPDGAPVVGYVGRLTRDKGIGELLDAFDRVSRRQSEARLLLVGGFEDGDPVEAAAARRLREHPRVVYAGSWSDTAPCYAMIDVLAFASRGEGLPNVPLEAAAAEVPVVAFRVTGNVDAVVDGQTGRLVAPGDVTAFADAIEVYLMTPAVRREHGLRARHRVEREFAPEIVWAALEGEYRRLLASRAG
jgi:glycosyltransferase involved in cell wall biosynthesis